MTRWDQPTLAELTGEDATEAPPEGKGYFYLDEAGAAHGPYSLSDMQAWYTQDYLPAGTLVRKDTDTDYADVNTWTAVVDPDSAQGTGADSPAADIKAAVRAKMEAKKAAAAAAAGGGGLTLELAAPPKLSNPTASRARSKAGGLPTRTPSGRPTVAGQLTSKLSTAEAEILTLKKQVEELQKGGGGGGGGGGGVGGGGAETATGEDSASKARCKELEEQLAAERKDAAARMEELNVQNAAALEALRTELQAEHASQLAKAAQVHGDVAGKAEADIAEAVAKASEAAAVAESKLKKEHKEQVANAKAALRADLEEEHSKKLANSIDAQGEWAAKAKLAEEEQAASLAKMRAELEAAHSQQLAHSEGVNGDLAAKAMAVEDELAKAGEAHEQLAAKHGELLAKASKADTELMTMKTEIDEARTMATAGDSAALQELAKAKGQVSELSSKLEDVSAAHAAAAEERNTAADKAEQKAVEQAAALAAATKLSEEHAAQSSEYQAVAAALKAKLTSAEEEVVLASKLASGGQDELSAALREAKSLTDQAVTAQQQAVAAQQLAETQAVEATRNAAVEAESAASSKTQQAAIELKAAEVEAAATEQVAQAEQKVAAAEQLASHRSQTAATVSQQLSEAEEARSLAEAALEELRTELELERKKSAAASAAVDVTDAGAATEALLAEQEKMFTDEAANLSQSLRLAQTEHLGTKDELQQLQDKIVGVEAAQADAHNKLVAAQEAHADDMQKLKVQYEQQLAAAKAKGTVAAAATSSGQSSLYSTIYYEEAPDVPSPEIRTEAAAALIGEGKLLASTKVWTVGMPDWRRLVDVKHLFSTLATVPFPSDEIKYTSLYYETSSGVPSREISTSEVRASPPNLNPNRGGTYRVTH